MKDRNLCHESGCPDLCCSNKYFVTRGGSALSDEEIRINFGTAKVINVNVDVRTLDKDGLYQIGESRKSYYIKGKCPRNVNGCASPLKPRACVGGFPFAGRDCNETRRDGGLQQMSGVNSDGEIIYKKGLLSRWFRKK